MRAWNVSVTRRAARSARLRSVMSRSAPVKSAPPGRSIRVTPSSTGNSRPSRCMAGISTRLPMRAPPCPVSTCLRSASEWVACSRCGMITSASGTPTTSSRFQPNVRSAAAFHSTIRPCASMATKASSAEARMPAFKASLCRTSSCARARRRNCPTCRPSDSIGSRPAGSCRVRENSSSAPSVSRPTPIGTTNAVRRPLPASTSDRDRSLASGRSDLHSGSPDRTTRPGRPSAPGPAHSSFSTSAGKPSCDQVARQRSAPSGSSTQAAPASQPRCAQAAPSTPRIASSVDADWERIRASSLCRARRRSNSAMRCRACCWARSGPARAAAARRSSSSSSPSCQAVRDPASSTPASASPSTSGSAASVRRPAAATGDPSSSGSCEASPALTGSRTRAASCTRASGASGRSRDRPAAASRRRVPSRAAWSAQESTEGADSSSASSSVSGSGAASTRSSARIACCRRRAICSAAARCSSATARAAARAPERGKGSSASARSASSSETCAGSAPAGSSSVEGSSSRCANSAGPSSSSKGSRPRARAASRTAALQAASASARRGDTALDSRSRSLGWTRPPIRPPGGS